VAEDLERQLAGADCFRPRREAWRNEVEAIADIFVVDIKSNKIREKFKRGILDACASAVLQDEESSKSSEGL
jgi:hypothetical protein